MIEDFVKLIPSHLHDKVGKVFYSGRRAFEAPSPLYVLGLNPGGRPERFRADETVGADAAQHGASATDSWSAYRDESWSHRGELCAPGTAPLQKRMLHMFAKLGFDPATAPASNIVFVRSRKGSDLGRIEPLASACWPFHEAVIKSLEVRVVACLGKTAGDWVRHQLSAHRQVDEFVERNNRKWRRRSCLFRNADGLMVATLSHPGRANWCNPLADPTGLIARAVGEELGS